MKAREPDTAQTGEDLRRRRSLRTREALGAAAVDLVLEHGLGGFGVEAIVERAQVTRRTFSRYFPGKEDAALDFTRADGARINDALRRRPAAEPPLAAYRAAVLDRLTDAGRPAGHVRPKERAVLALVDREPDLLAAYARIRAEAQAASVRVLADRIGVDPDRDPRPGLVVEVGAGVLSSVLHAWARETEGDAAELAARVDRAYDLLGHEVAAATDHRHHSGPRTVDPGARKGARQ
ncbi:TetR family transcriptional regulator [Streptomyces sp. NPDC046716]|uniref:TetR/AcrR family transcriptional regulator n=1 Tax=Streptomyces sp. NPDC046716 TaxID=3157093 RepID=UPI0033CFFC22